MPLTSPLSIGHGGSGLNDRLPKILKELQSAVVPTLLTGAGANTNIALAGAQVGATILRVLEVPTAAVMVDRTSVASITSAGNLQLTVATTGNQLLVWWTNPQTP